MAAQMATLGFRVYGWWRCCHTRQEDPAILPLLFSAALSQDSFLCSLLAIFRPKKNHWYLLLSLFHFSKKMAYPTS